MQKPKWVENSIIIQNFLSCFLESMVWQEKLSKWCIVQAWRHPIPQYGQYPPKSILFIQFRTSSKTESKICITYSVEQFNFHQKWMVLILNGLLSKISNKVAAYISHNKVNVHQKRMVFVPNGWSSKIITYFITCVNIHQKKEGISSKVNYHPRYKAYFQHHSING